MAEKRMFSNRITESDAFLSMPLSSQALYFHLNMNADDEGFVNSYKKIMRMIGCNEDDLRILFTKRFILGFNSGVIVIKHWKLHNWIRGDRLKETDHTDEKASLLVKENGVYTEKFNNQEIECQTTVRQVSDNCQHSIDKIRLEEIRLEENSNSAAEQQQKKSNGRFVKPTVQEIQAYMIERKNNLDAQYFFDYYESKGWLVGKSPMKNWKATIRNWEKNNKKFNNEKSNTSISYIDYNEKVEESKSKEEDLIAIKAELAKW